MDNFILIIGHDINSDHMKKLGEHVLSLFPSSEQYNCSQIWSPEISLLMKPCDVYGTVLSKCDISEEVKWLGPFQNTVVFDSLFSKEILCPESKSESTPKDFSEQLSERIHLLADQLPAFGTYRLNVFINYDVLKDLSISEEPVLAGAFYRLTRWHAACFNMFVEKHSDPLRLSEWCEIMHADVISEENSSLNAGPSLWRGSFELKDSKVTESSTLRGLELQLDLIENDKNIFLHQQSPENTSQETHENIILASRMQLIDHCSFASIPPYMISPLIFRIHVRKQNMFNENSVEFLSNLAEREEAAVILRLYYSRTREKNREKKYCTNRWKRAVSSGSIKDAETFLSSFESYVTFVATKSSKSNHIIAQVIRNPNTIDPSFYFHLLNLQESKLSNSVSMDSRNCDLYRNVLKGIPFIETPLFYKVLEILKVCNSHLASQSDPALKDKISNEIALIWEEIRLASRSSLLDNATSSDVIFEKKDPSDWPERLYLLNKQMQNEKKPFLSNALSNLGPKLPIQSVSFSSADVQKYFLPSGEPKNSAISEFIQPLSNINHRACHKLETLLSMKWPEVAECFYHDLYYNVSDQSEEKENVGNQMVNLYVKHETASTCNKQQITQNFAIIIQDKSSPATKEFRSPSKRKILNADKQTNPKESSDCTENSVRDLITKKILSTRRSSSQNLAKRKEEVKDSLPQHSTKRGVKRKIEVPTRCSPRKKNLVNYASSANSNAKTSKNSRVSKSNELPELLRKKLRHAVATALENNGVSMSDVFFQPCGKKLFTICQAFVQDIPQKKGKTSEHLQKIADAHVKQVIEFEKQKLKK